MQFEDNEFFIETQTDFLSPLWRIEILNAGMQVVRILATEVRKVSPYPLQIVLGINSGLDADIEDGPDATVGTVKFFVLREKSKLDHRVGVDRVVNPAAVFTVVPESDAGDQG